MTKKNNIIADARKEIQDIINNKTPESNILFAPDFIVEDIWPNYKHLFVNTQLANPKLCESHNLCQQYNIPLDDDSEVNNYIYELMKKLGLEDLPELHMDYKRDISTCHYLGISVNEYNELNGVLDILDKVKYINDRYEIKAYLKGAKLIKLKLPDNRILIASYIHVYYGKDLDLTERQAAQTDLTEKQIIMNEGELPLHLED